MNLKKVKSIVSWPRGIESFDSAQNRKVYNPRFEITKMDLVNRSHVFRITGIYFVATQYKPTKQLDRLSSITLIVQCRCVNKL